ncbi:MAG: DEAD/DEAH box helicase [Edaphobacter sp.]|uniref:DEAD/DEAH box helicase n=1 Tax=Edaphobacter sp. TaxID=1934404 RepID=UPI0023848A9F|nr:DEAD/DEAH box helicase [Edaphobacter sp.]MDE1176111.1 DEAD/DEAH box helicase [Edaphobacter sp.]
MPVAAGETEAIEIPASLSWAHPVTAEWFLRRFGSPTEPQQEGWPAIAAGETTLISAPTGSGKTLAAFLVAIDQLLREAIAGTLPAATQILYVSPLKALSNDVQKNLDQPLREIQHLALERGYLSTEIRTGVRTGDTLQKDRTAMLRNPPHILVTTPESLYIMLTAGKARETIRRVRTVIVDEIHAIADDKRGAHLSLSLERLDSLVCGENRLSVGEWLTGRANPPQRIGLSATQNPIELVAEFLTGVHPDRRPAKIVQVGQRRELNLAIEVPSDELSSVLTTKMWEELFDKLATCTQTHRSTLVFVNTRRLVERIAFALAERLGPENVAAHHGSLSRTLRLDAEQRLKSGEIRILVATASLELGIDIGDIDLVCQIATTRSVSVAMQRVGRAGHWRGAVPKGRFFATTRDDLVEQAALIRRMRSGDLDLLEIPPEPIDVLMQQIVASCGAEPWDEDALYAVLTRALPYRNLSRGRFDEIVALLVDGIESSRGRYGSYLLRDGIHGQLHPRRGARMNAILNGGAIPETNLYSVILQPEGTQIATLDEHFAVDSSPGDVVLLGNSSWRIQRVEAAGRVLVEDAHGAPPSLPFWEGEAPQRTAILSDGVGELRQAISELTCNITPGYISPADPEVDQAIAWLKQHCGVCDGGAMQLIAYIVSGRAVLGSVPTKRTIIAERFFDDGGGMQLILHAPFGGRINKAWGLALRKRFCRGFNFELQAAATDNGINISLAEQHSFPLSDVFQFLTEHTARELLEQAALASPIFKTRWRWAANRSLQLLRFSKGKRIPPQIQRMRSEDLLASVFPQAAACFENIEGDIQIPAHPLVDEVMKDVLGEAMDLEGLIEVLRGIQDGSIQCLAVDTPVPSQFAHELLNANPYAYLDEAGLEERRARAVTLSRVLPASVLEEAGRLEQSAIDEVRRECWPDIRDEHELHDLLQSLVALPLEFFADRPAARHWPTLYDRLAPAGRARVADCNGIVCWSSTERTAYVEALWGNTAGEAGQKEQAFRQCVQGWVQLLGPTTAASFATRLGLPAAEVFQAFLAMEMQGLLMRGLFEHGKPEHDHQIEWCERRILQRIHRRTLHTLRKQIEPLAPAVYMRWLLEWQHLAPQTQLSGEEGVLEALHQLEGFEAPAIEWERSLLRSRVANYDPRWLDALCLSGAVGWGRISPHPAWSNADGTGPRRVVPTNAAPITFYIRETAEWLPHALARERIEDSRLAASLSAEALAVRSLLSERGACFANDMQRILGLSRQQTQQALWELATAGLAAADGYDQLRSIMDPRRKPSAEPKSVLARRPTRSTAGRWSLLTEEVHAAPSAIEQARRNEAALTSYACMLLTRYGILSRDLLTRESNAPKWRDLVAILRRMEARGEVRGGRFVTGFGGEQFALPEAADSLRASRSRESQTVIAVSAADPANLAGIVLPGDRVPAIPGHQVFYRNGKIHHEGVNEEAASEPAEVPSALPLPATAVTGSLPIFG